MRFSRLLIAAALLVSFQQAYADKKTVCTITVNSPDEKNIFRRYLPQEDFDFVELVERGRPDWLESACRKGVRCDVLLISGHFDDGTQFYSDRVDAREYLPVDELERASCSESCPGLFSQLKEVYLFGCNTLNDQALRSASAEVARSLVRSGHSAADADRLVKLLNEQHADSNRDRMRQIFHDVPVIYGFSSKAPLGPTAASVLDRYFQSGAKAEIGGGRPSARLLSLFAPVSLTVSNGLGASELQSAYRRDVCEFSDDRLSPAHKLEFVHQLLGGRNMAEVRMFLDRIEGSVASLSAADRRDVAVTHALEEIAPDRAARGRFLEFARDADEASTRARMIALAHELGWLTDTEKRAELVQMLADQLARNAVGPAEIHLACSLEEKHALGADIDRLHAWPARGSVASSAILACLGNRQARGRVLQALASSDDRDVQLAQVYLQDRPIADALELRVLVTAVARMSGSDAQVRALETLARLQLSDRDTLLELARLFPNTKSLNVQRAIAGVLIRADYSSLEKPELMRALRDHRLKSSEGPDVIDMLIRRLQS